MKYVLIVLLLLFTNLSYAQSHNAEPNNISDKTIILMVKVNGVELDASDADNIDDDFLFYISAEKGTEKVSFGTADEYGNETIDSFYDNIKNSFFMPDNPLILYMDFADFSGKIGDDPDEVTIQVKVFNRKTGESGELVYLAGSDWSPEDYEYIEVGEAQGTTLVVSSVTAGCWEQGGTFDLTRAFGSKSPETATVEYYTDADGNVKIMDPTNVAMPGSNLSSSTEVIKYYARAIDGSEKSEIQTIEVTFFQKPEVSLGADRTACNNETITLETTGSVGTYSYFKESNLLGTGVHNQDKSKCDVLVTETATYAVKVTSNNGCEGSASVKVTMNPAVPAGEINITGGGTSICAGKSVTLTASIPGYSSGVTYEWGSPVAADDRTEATITVFPTTTTTYTVDVKLNGCSSVGNGASQTITVNPIPTLVVTNPAAVCGGTVDITQKAAVNITQTGDGYKYYSDAELKNEVDATKVAAGTYYVTKTEKGCTSAEKTVTATVNTPPTPKILVNGSASAPGDICAGTEVTLTCDDTYSTYTWTGGPANNKEWKATIAEGSNTFKLTVVDANGCTGTATDVAITGKKAPTVTIDPVDAACGGDVITLVANPTWQTGEQTVRWQGNNVADAGSKTTTATLAGDANKYDVTVTDQNGCTGTASVTVTGNILKATGLRIDPLTVRSGNQVTLEITAHWNGEGTNDGVSYLWKRILPAPESVIGTNKSVTDRPDANSTYEVVVAKGGCKDSIQGNVTVETDPFAVEGIAGYRAVCDGEDLSAAPMKLYVTATGGQKNYTYAWTVPNGLTVEATNTDTLKITGIDYTKIIAGSSETVSVKVGDASTPANTAIKTLQFEVRELPKIAINGKSDGATIDACKDVAMTLTASVAGVTSGVNYSWSTGGTGAQVNASVGTVGTSSYKVTATYAGCTDDATVDVTVNELPDLSLTATVAGTDVTNVCPGTEIQLTATVAGVDNPNVSWTNAGLSGTAPKATVNAYSAYIVNYTDATTGCSATKQASVGVYLPANLGIAVTSGTSQVCAGSEVVLKASNGASYQWLADGNELAGETGDVLTVHPTANTVYTVKGKDANNCEAKDASAPITITSAPTLALLTGKDKMNGCEGSSVELNNAVDWNSSSSGTTLKVKDAQGTVLSGTTVTAGGTYRLYLEKTGGDCPSTDKMVEVTFHALPNVTFQADKPEVCSGEGVVLTASSSDATQPTFTYNGNSGTTWTATPTDAGTATYTVTAKDAYGCTNTDDASVTVKPLPDVQIADQGPVCAGTEVTLTASGADTYEWKDGAVTIGTDATYTKTISKSNNKFEVVGTKDGCSKSDNITLDVLDAPDLAEATPLEACMNATKDLKDAFTTSYSLSFFDENKNTPLPSSSVVVTANQTYYAKATVGTCSTDFKPIEVKVKALPNVEIVGSDEACAGTAKTLTVTGTAESYTWNPGTANATTGSSLTVTPTANTTYTVRAQGVNGCTADATLEVKVNPLPELKWDDTNPSELVAGTSRTWNVSLVQQTSTPYVYTWTHNGTVDPNYTNANYSLTGTVNPENLEVFVVDGKGCQSAPLTKSVPVKPQGGELSVTLTADGSEEICQGGVQVLTANPQGGMLPYKYVWYKNGDDMGIADDVATITVSDAAIYRVEVSDAGATPQTKDASVTMRMSSSQTAPTVTVPDLTIPTGNSTVLLAEVTPAAGSYTYRWSPAADLKGTGEASLAAPETKILTETTTYEVLVKAGGCYAAATGTVRVDGANGFKVSVSAEQDNVCVGNTVQLNTALSGNVPDPVTYEWIPADGLSDAHAAAPVFTASSAGTREYVVKVTGGGYVAVAKTSIVIKNQTAPTLQLTPAGGDLCVGGKITVTANGSVSNYQWIIDGRDPVSGSASIDTLAAGTRHVKVTATAACSVNPVEADYVIHELPVVDWAANTPSVADKGSVFTITAVADGGINGNYTYDWSGTPGGTASGDSYTLTFGKTASSKTFKVKVTNEATGCTSTDLTKTITLLTATDPVEIAVNAENVNLCQDGVALLEVTGVKGGQGHEDTFEEYEYAWTVAGNETVLSTEKIYVATADGTYTVKVTEPKSSKSVTKDITVTNSSDQAPQVADATLTVEMNKQAYLFAAVTGGTPEYTYSWMPVNALASASMIASPTTSALSAPETYTCYVTDANGCSGVGTVQVNVTDVSDPKLFDLTAKADNTNPCSGNTVNLTVNSSRPLNNPTYRWMPSDGLSADDVAHPEFTASMPGTKIYTVQVTEEDGYSVTAQVAVTVKDKEAPRLAFAGDAGECAGEKLTVENTNTNTDVANYQWIINGVADPSVTGSEYPLGSGEDQTVQVIANAKDGCTSDTLSGVFDRKPTPPIAWNEQPSSIAYEGDDFIISVAEIDGATYVWSYVYTDPDGTTEEGDGADMNEFEMTDAAVGTYEFTVYIELDGCRSEVLEHSVTVFEKGDELRVTTDITGTKEICGNGSAVVTATGHNGSGTYTYAWYAGTRESGTLVATGATAILSPTNNNQKYVVEVNDGTTTAVSAPITLKFNNNTAPGITGGTQHVAAGHATVLLSQVTSGTVTGYHWSSPNNLLADGEEEKAHPTTLPLSADETFTYYVTDANGCVSKPADVNVVADASADALAIDVIADMTDLCRGNVTHLNVVATQGSLSESATYEWTPSDYLTGANTASPLFTATVAGDYAYLVKVNDGGKTFVAGVDLTVKSFDAPGFDWDPTNPTSFEKDGAFVMKTQLTTTTEAPYNYHWTKPIEQTSPIGQFSVQTATESAYDFEVTMSDAHGCFANDTLRARLEVSSSSGDQIEIEAQDVTVCADGTATLRVEKTAGPDDVVYAWTSTDIPAIENANMAEATADLKGITPGFHRVRITVTAQGDNTNSAFKDISVVIAPSPVVKIDQTCLALYKDSTVVLNVANAKDYDYLWQESKFEGSQDLWQLPENKETGTSATVIMNDQSLRYILIGTTRDELQCSASDTATIYRIPDAPVLAIDTNTNHLDIMLKWGAVGDNDDYTVWSRKWDPYCLTSEDGGVYAEETTTTQYQWAENSMDTLEFYYVTANKNVCGQTYRSVSSDTVGYKYDSLYVNPIPGRNNLNLVAWMFDMKNVQTSENLFELITSEYIEAIYAWSFSIQSFAEGITLNPLFQWGIGDKYDKSFDRLVVGSVYHYSVIKNTALLQYGKLTPVTYELKQPTPTGDVVLTNLNMIMLPLNHANLVRSDSMLDELGSEVTQSIYYWNFEDQGFTTGTAVNPLFQWGIGDKYDGVIRIYPGLPISLDYVNPSESKKW